MIVADLAHTARYGTVRLAVLLLYVLASTTIGFAHRLAMPAEAEANFYAELESCAVAA